MANYGDDYRTDDNRTDSEAKVPTSTEANLMRKVVSAILIAIVCTACSSTQTRTVIERPAASVTASKPLSLQFNAHTSVGTGAIAQAWSEAILSALNAPANRANLSSMLAWFMAEDNHTAAGQYTYGAGENNPLNLTADSGDVVGVTGSEPSGAGPTHPGNLNFRTPDYGIAATAEVIQTRYPSINQALLLGEGLIHNPKVASGLREWSGGGYSVLN